MLLIRLAPLVHCYDTLNTFWEKSRTQRAVAAIILSLYFMALLGVELKRWDVLPTAVASFTPDSHTWAIHMTFTLILGVEVISLIFCISDSFSRSVGKQLEILALIQLRDAFKQLGALTEPITIADHWEPVIHIALCAAGALAIFVALRIFVRLGQRQPCEDNQTALLYVYSKKLLCLVLLCVVLIIGVMHTAAFLSTGERQHFFETVYTALIYADITLVLLAQRYMPTFNAVFRNSGFVVSTLMMRLSLSAAAPLDTLLAVFSACYVILLVWVFHYFRPVNKHAKREPVMQEDGCVPEEKQSE